MSEAVGGGIRGGVISISPQTLMLCCSPLRDDNFPVVVFRRLHIRTEMDNEKVLCSRLHDDDQNCVQSGE